MPGLPAVWFAVLIAAVAWYLQFRYLRYLLPSGALAVVAIGLALPGRVRTRRAELVALGAVALSAVMFWPSTVALFWNVPGRDIPLAVALGSRADHDYERASMIELDALDAYDRLAPPGALALGDPHQRLAHRGSRPFSVWEVTSRLEIDGPMPTGARLYSGVRRSGSTG